MDTTTEDGEGHFSVRNVINDIEKSEGTFLSRCPCHLRRQISQSFSMGEVSLFEKQGAVYQLQNRCISLQESLAANNCHIPRRASANPSDLSLNHESNVSEDKNIFINHFEYHSLDGVDSSDTDCNSIQVNFDEGSTMNNISLKEDEASTDAEDAGVNTQQVDHQTVSNCTLQDSNESLNQIQKTVSSSSLKRCNDASDIKQVPYKMTKSRSTKEKRRKCKKNRIKMIVFSSCSNSANQCSISNPEIHQRKTCFVTRTRNCESASDLDILPIFKQLIAQKHQEATCPKNQSFDSDKEEQALSCPDLAIKCDVVEYF